MSLQELNTSHEYNLFIESLNKEQDMVDCWQEKVYEVSFYIEDNQLTTLIKINLIYHIQNNDNNIYENNTNNTNILSNKCNEDRNDVSNKKLNNSKNFIWIQLRLYHQMLNLHGNYWIRCKFLIFFIAKYLYWKNIHYITDQFLMLLKNC